MAGGQMGGQPRRFPQQGGKGQQQFQTPQGYMVANQGGAPQRQNRQNRGRGKGDARGAPAGGRGQAQQGKGGGRGGQQFSRVLATCLQPRLPLNLLLLLLPL